MSKPDISPSINVDDIVSKARTQWACACTFAPDARVELYLKVAHRSRVERGPSRDLTSLRIALESGTAARVWTPQASAAGFAAAAGFSRAVTSTVVTRARDGGSLVAGDSPELGSAVDIERWDLDADEPPISRATVDSVFEQTPLLDALELGTTVEVLIGPGGWLAARRRNRAWVSRGGAGPRLAARRGFKDWVALLAFPEVVDPPILQRTGVGCVLLPPQAAAPIVSALASKYYATADPPRIRGGSGWSLGDDPLRVDGLAGGAFDDAGFPAGPRELAAFGTSTGSIWGPGTFWRSSFRSPPTPGASNLTMFSQADSSSKTVAIRAASSRLLPLAADVWVLALDLGGTRAYIRLAPQEWMARIAEVAGEEEVTTDGPILRSVLLENLPVTVAG